MKSTSQIIAENPRMAYAMLGSMLAHAGLVAALSVALLKAPPVRPVAIAGFTASLVARIAGEKEPEVRGEPGRAPLPRVAPRESVVLERPPAAFVAPAFEGSAVDSEAIALSVDAGEGAGDADGYRGVSVTETLFQRALPADFRKILLEYPGFFQGMQISRPPQLANLVMPRYPVRELAALKQSYAWIVVAFFVDEKGNVVAAVPVTGSEGYEHFQDQVAAAMRESTFAAGERFGLPVKSFTYQMIEFRLEDRLAAEPPPSIEPAIAAP